MLSLIFLLLSFDEAACIHEGLGNILSHRLHTSGIFTYAWVIPGGIFMLLVCICSMGFLRHLPERTRRDVVIAGAIYVTGTLGWEMAGGWYDSVYGSRNLTYMTLTVREEAFESAGIILFINSLLIYLKEHAVIHPQNNFIGVIFRKVLRCTPLRSRLISPRILLILSADKLKATSKNTMQAYLLASHT